MIENFMVYLNFYPILFGIYFRTSLIIFYNFMLQLFQLKQPASKFCICHTPWNRSLSLVLLVMPHCKNLLSKKSASFMLIGT